MPPFYGLTYAEMDTPEALDLFSEAAPMTWYHSGGPPVFLYYPTNDDPLPDHSAIKTWETGEEDPLADRAVHHPKMGKLIKSKLDALGVECTLHIDVGGRVPEVQAEMVAFFKHHLMA
jgi:hypothetical protein